MDKLSSIPTKDLREINAEIIRDYIICIADKVSLDCWAEDLQDDPDAYSYTIDELEQFIFLLNYNSLLLLTYNPTKL